MTDSELAAIIEQMQAAWDGGKPAEGGVPVDPKLNNHGRVVVLDRSVAVAAATGSDEPFALRIANILASAPSWVVALVREVLALRAVLGDVMRDGGIEQGVRQERGRIEKRILLWMDDVRDSFTRSDISAQEHGLRSGTLQDVLDGIVQDASDDVADPLPPEQSMTEILRLRKLIRDYHAMISNPPPKMTDDIAQSLAAIAEIANNPSP